MTDFSAVFHRVGEEDSFPAARSSASTTGKPDLVVECAVEFLVCLGNRDLGAGTFTAVVTCRVKIFEPSRRAATLWSATWDIHSREFVSYSVNKWLLRSWDNQ